MVSTMLVAHVVKTYFILLFFPKVASLLADQNCPHTQYRLLTVQVNQRIYLRV